MENLTVKYENAILHALVGCTPQQMDCTDARTAVSEYVDEFALKETPIELLKSFIGMCTPTEFERLKDMDFDITDKYMNHEE
jgi:hypothetical protein